MLSYSRSQSLLIMSKLNVPSSLWQHRCRLMLDGRTKCCLRDIEFSIFEDVSRPMRTILHSIQATGPSLFKWSLCVTSHLKNSQGNSLLRSPATTRCNNTKEQRVKTVLAQPVFIQTFRARHVNTRKTGTPSIPHSLTVRAMAHCHTVEDV